MSVLNRWEETMGVSKMMRGRLSEAEMQNRLMEQENDYRERNERLLETFEKKDGLGLNNGVLAEMADKDYYKALSLVRMLENTESSFQRKLKEYQTSSYMGITPQEIVRVFRFAYGDSVTPELFNVWGMESVKDTFYKIETKYGSTKRGATQGETIYENYGDGGRYPTSYDEDSSIQGDDSTTNFTGTLSVVPAIPYSFKVYGPNGIMGTDDGNGNISGTAATGTFSGTIDYTTGDFDITFTAAPATGEDYVLEYAHDAEQEILFDEVGTVSLGLVPYDFRAKWHSMEATWHRMTEEVSQSKLGRSARTDLLDGISDIIRKSQDEFFTKKAIQASKWTSALTFDTNFANNGANSDYANAQALVSVIEDARGKAYSQLGRYPARTNLLVGYKAKSYLAKIDGFQYETNPNEVGFFKAGQLGSYGVYVAPPGAVDSNMIYMFGRGKDALATDAVVSIGMYKGEFNSDELEFKSFKNEVGIGYMLDYRINNKYMASAIELENL